MRWFVLHALSGHEEKVAQTLRHMQEMGRLDDDVAEILVPYENKLESYKGKKREVKRKMYPGYVLVRMNLTNENRHILRQVQGVIGFVGSVDTPQPLTDTEVDQIINRMHQEEPEIDLAYGVGDTIKVVTGPFTEAIGKVKEIEIERRKVKILVSVFGRDTQVELDFEQVEPFEPEEKPAGA